MLKEKDKIKLFSELEKLNFNIAKHLQFSNFLDETVLN